MNLLALAGFVALFSAVCAWCAGVFVRKGGSTAPLPGDPDYGAAALERQQRAPSLPPPGYEEILVPPPHPPRSRRCGE